jgi:DNA-binding transcriptional regulator YiaG
MTPYGQGVSIRHTEDLHKAIGLYLVEHRKALGGKEIRFLRNALDLTQAELAHLLGCDSQSVARWEKEQTEMPPASDRLLRLLFLEGVAGRKPSVKSVLAAFDEREDDAGHVEFVSDKKGWRVAA